MSYVGRQLNAPASTVQLTASKDLTAGNPVIVKSDGKATKLGSTLGSALTVISSNVNFVVSAFDSTNNKVVVACTDEGSSDVGKAFVVSVSGTTCTAGSVVQFSSGGADNLSITFDSSNGKVVICYRDKNNSNYGTAIVGTVSGTSISFGTAVVFESANTTAIGSTFDSSSNNKVVVGYRDVPDSGQGKVRVLTVSGTSISDGGAVTFNSASTTSISLTFDSSSNKVVIAYEDNGNSSYGTAIVGTVSGTSISYGSEVVFESAEVRDVDIAFDSTNNKVLIVYADVGNSNYGTAVVGTVSGTSISFGTPVVYTSTEVGYFPSVSFNPDTGRFGVFVYSSDSDFYEATISGTSVSFSGSTEIDSDVGGNQSVIYDTNADVFVFAYPDGGNSSHATIAALELGPALTSENFIGFAEEDVTADGLATIQLGGSVNDKQTGLTAGQTYFVQTDGTIGLTADSPSVTAGTAVSSTEILVKG